MPRYASPDGKGTNDPNAAVKVNGQPQDNPARNVWINETALSTALQSSYMAEQLANFGFVTGIALLLSGIGFGILAGAGALRNRETALGFLQTIQYYGNTATTTNAGDFPDWQRIYGTNQQRINRLQAAFTNIMQTGIQVSLIQ